MISEADLAALAITLKLAFASTLVLLRLASRHPRPDVAFEPSAARALPGPYRASAADDFVDAAAHAGAREREALLRVAVALGATPKFELAPWSAVAPGRRPRLEREARDGR